MCGGHWLNSIEKEQKAKLGIIIALMRVAYIIFIGLAIASLLPDADGDLRKIQIHIMVLVGVMTIAWWQWIAINKKPRLWEQPKLIDYIELLLVVVAVTWIMYIGGLRRNIFKVLYIFIVMANAFRFDMKYGVTSAIISSTGVIFYDMTRAGIRHRDLYLEGDLLLLCSFFLLAFIMGYLALCQKENIERMASMADKDELTGLYNNRAFHERLLHIIEQAVEVGRYSNVWVVLLDIADFRKYNELYGYAMGNTVIAQIADIISSEAGRAELISRCDGDKYGLIFTDCGLEDIKNIVDRIKNSVERYPFYGKNAMPGGTIIMHSGVAGYPIDGLTKEEIMKAANRNMDAVRFVYNKVQPFNFKQTEALAPLEVFINIINSRDHYTYEHAQRVATYAGLLAEALNLSPHRIAAVQCGAYLHDIGKIEVPPDILNKNGPLTSEEAQMLGKHVLWGADIVESIRALAYAVPIVKYHHERWDGKGYPEGLSGKTIPLEARIVALADGFDRMTTGRWPDGRYSGVNSAIQWLAEHAGTYFDPDLVDIFIKSIQDHEILKLKSI